MSERIVIASRRSRLAMWQSEHVAGELKRLYPHCEVSILGITTRGDQIVDRPLAQIGGRGLFVKELQAALEVGRADIAVHSAKDVPMRLPAPGQGGLVIECREDRSELLRRLAPLGDFDTSACVLAERALSRALSGDCQLPLAAYAVTSGAEIRLRGLVAMPDGSKVVRAESIGPIAAPEELGEVLAAKLRALGADAILESLS